LYHLIFICQSINTNLSLINIKMSHFPIRVLVVDDEPDLCELTKEFLERQGGLKVDIAHSVKEGRAAMNECRYDAIVSDYQMPGEDGIRFLKTLRAREDTVPFILFTGRGREEVVIEALNEGADAYLQKGGDVRSQFVELEHKVREAVRRDKAELALKENEVRLTRAQDIGKTGCWEFKWDEEGGHIWGSSEGLRIFGIQRPEDGMVPLSQIEMCILDSERVHKALEDLVGKGSDYDIEYEIAPADGGPHRFIHSEAKLILDERGRPLKVTGTIHDITKLQESDKRIRRQNRELMAIKECNHALVKARTEKELLDEVCRIVCEVAGYRLAWIGMAENDAARSVRPVAMSCNDNGYVAQIRATWGEDVRGLGPTGMSIKTGKTIFIQDFENDPRTGPWKELARSNGYRSSIALPLMDSGSAFGTFLLYSDQVNGFTSEELELLEEMARDLAFGIVGLRARIEQEAAELAIKESEERFRTLSENTFEGIVITIDDILHDVNDSFCSSLGYRADEMMGRNMSDFVTSGSLEVMKEMQKTKSPGPYEVQAITKRGDILTVQVRGKDIFWKGRRARLKAIRDITEQKLIESALYESEERYRSIYFDSRDAIMILSPERTYVDGNPATCRLFGLRDNRDLISCTPSSLSPEYQPDGSLSSEKSVQMMDMALVNGTHFFEWTHRKMDGTEFPATVLLSRYHSSETGRGGAPVERGDHASRGGLRSLPPNDHELGRFIYPRC
jgi:PAS domain S-box-containing protein